MSIKLSSLGLLKLWQKTVPKESPISRVVVRILVFIICFAFIGSGFDYDESGNNKVLYVLLGDIAHSSMFGSIPLGQKHFFKKNAHYLTLRE
jgi:hypothetical protein